MSATTERLRELLTTRLAEIDEERGRVERAIEALGTIGNPARARPKRRHRHAEGNRADQAVELIHKSPGTTASDIAKAMKIKPNYLYRVLGNLEKAGRVKKKGRSYYPAG